MKPVRCRTVICISLLLSTVYYALAWQFQPKAKAIIPPRLAPHSMRCKFSIAGQVRNSQPPAVSAQESEDPHSDCSAKTEATERMAKHVGGMRILHEDDVVIALNKPAGIPLFPLPSNSAASAATHSDSVIERVIAHYRSISDSVPIPETLKSLYTASGVSGDARERVPLETEIGSWAPTESQQPPGVDAIVHRLDHGTSGVLLLAKTAAAASSLRQQFRERRVKKIYFAVIQGRLNSPMTVTSCIGRDPNDRRKMQSARQIWGVHGAATPVASGKLRGAVTLFKPLLFNRQWSVVLASPVTGRTHQIRLHLQMLKTPIIGDPLYGDACATSAFLASAVALRSESRSRSSAGVQHEGPTKTLGKKGQLRPLLHAAELCCIHPTSSDGLRVRAPLPQDMREAMTVVDPLWPEVPELTPFAGAIQ